jgi:hypothetical protein
MRLFKKGQCHIKELSIGNVLLIIYTWRLKFTMYKNFITVDKLEGKPYYNNQLYTCKVSYNKAIT